MTAEIDLYLGGRSSQILPILEGPGSPLKRSDLEFSLSNYGFDAIGLCGHSLGGYFMLVDYAPTDILTSQQPHADRLASLGFTPESQMAYVDGDPVKEWEALRQVVRFMNSKDIPMYVVASSGPRAKYPREEFIGGVNRQRGLKIGNGLF